MIGGVTCGSVYFVSVVEKTKRRYVRVTQAKKVVNLPLAAAAAAAVAAAVAAAAAKGNFITFLAWVSSAVHFRKQYKIDTAIWHIHNCSTGVILLVFLLPGTHQGVLGAKYSNLSRTS